VIKVVKVHSPGPYGGNLCGTALLAVTSPDVAQVTCKLCLRSVRKALRDEQSADAAKMSKRKKS
jgi:hypothetical protein